MSVDLCVYLMCTSAHRRGGSGPLELELQTVLGHLLWVLRTIPLASAKAANALNC